MKMIPLFKVAMHSQVDKSLSKTIHSGFIGEGPRVKEFEKLLSEQFNNPYCLALNSGTSGLRLALELIATKNRGSGRHKIITSSLSCFATVAPILTSEKEIIWADIQQESLNIDPESIKEKIDERTLAILFVHWGGCPADLEEIREVADLYNVPIIEDAAHTFGADYRGSIIGDCCYSDYCILSFQAIKFLTTGDGGALFVKNQEDYEKGKLLRWFGINRDSPRIDMRCTEDIVQAGFKFQMNDIAATIGIKNLELVKQNLLKTEYNAKSYRKAFKNFPGITLIQNKTDRSSSNWIFTMLVEDVVGFARVMGEAGIMVSKVHTRIDTHSCVSRFRTDLPNLDAIDGKRICIPVGWWITKEDREYIIDSIKRGW